MSEIFYPPINCVIEFPESGLTYDQCKSLIDAESKGIFHLVDGNITKHSECSVKLYKQGLIFSNNNQFTEVFLNQTKLLKFIWKQEIVFINPNIKSESVELKNALISSLEAFPEHFTFVMKDLSLTKQNLIKELV